MLATLRVLILEDNKSDADLLNRALKKSGLNFLSEIVQTRIAFENSLISFKPDLILSDYALPAFDAVVAFQIKQNLSPHIPFIIVSGIIGEENAIELIKAGVTDYISKDKLFTLSHKIEMALKDIQTRNEKLQIDKQLKLLKQELLELNQELETRVIRRTKALAESENKFRTMMDTIPQIAWTNRINGEVIYYNQRWFNYIGITDHQTQWNLFKSVIHTEDFKNGFDQFKLILKNKEIGEFQIRLKRADKLYRWHLIRLMPILNEYNLLQQWVGTATDIQELKLLQQHKDDFIIIASHELKTPITSLKVSLQLLNRMKKNLDSTKFSLLIDQANKSLNKVNVLINDLLNSSIASKGELPLNKQNFNLIKMINECCVDIPLNGNYSVKIKGDLEVEVYADKIRIGQIVTNLINNSIKYAPDSKQIFFIIEDVGEKIKVSIKDEGPGISPEKLPYILIGITALKLLKVNILDWVWDCISALKSLKNTRVKSVRKVS